LDLGGGGMNWIIGKSGAWPKIFGWKLGVSRKIFGWKVRCLAENIWLGIRKSLENIWFEIRKILDISGMITFPSLGMLFSILCPNGHFLWRF
jgi:hypothetical protein